MSNTTTYHVIVGENVVAKATKKSKAIDAALDIRNNERVDVTVVTGSGTIVLEFAAPKKIKMSPPYTRVVALPEGVPTPDGFRVCYSRPRRSLAVLHNFDESYRLLNLKTGDLLDEVYPTTRAAGKALLVTTV